MSRAHESDSASRAWRFRPGQPRRPFFLHFRRRADRSGKTKAGTEDQAHQGPRLLDHTGRPLPADAAFVADAPPGLGRLLSASTTLSRGQDQTAWRLLHRFPRVLVACIPLVLLSAAGGWLVGLWGPWLGVAVGMLCLLQVQAGMREVFRCTWLGTEGFAIREIEAGWRVKPARTRILRFVDSEVLYSEGTCERKVLITPDGAMEQHSTVARHKWVDRQGRTIFVAVGADPGNGDVLDQAFLTAVDVQWSRWRVQRARERWRAGGAVEFPVQGDGAESLRVSALGLGVCFRDRPDVLLLRDRLHGVSVADGTIHIACEGDSLDLGYGEVGNARVFLAFMQRIVSVSV